MQASHQTAPGISDLMSSEYARGWHLTNLCFTSSFSGLRPGRKLENHATRVRDTQGLLKIRPDWSKGELTKVLRGGPRGWNAKRVFPISGIIFPIVATIKKIVFLPEFMGRWNVENNQPRARLLRNV